MDAAKALTLFTIIIIFIVLFAFMIYMMLSVLDTLNTQQCNTNNILCTMYTHTVGFLRHVLIITSIMLVLSFAITIIILAIRSQMIY